MKSLFLTIPIGLLIWLYSAKTGKSDLPRGIRNNNAGNLEFNEHVNWQGQIGSDGRFIIFETPFYGLRALARTLKTYRKNGFDTVSEIINRYAPSSENNTRAYINHVASKLNISPSVPVELVDYPQLMAAIITHENGQQPYSMVEIIEGWEAA